MREPRQTDLSPEDRRLAAGLIAAVLLAGIAANWLGIAHAVSGRSFF